MEGRGRGIKDRNMRLDWERTRAETESEDNDVIMDISDDDDIVIVNYVVNGRIMSPELPECESPRRFFAVKTDPRSPLDRKINKKSNLRPYDPASPTASSISSTSLDFGYSSHKSRSSSTESRSNLSTRHSSNESGNSTSWRRRDADIDRKPLIRIRSSSPIPNTTGQYFLEKEIRTQLENTILELWNESESGSVLRSRSYLNRNCNYYDQGNAGEIGIDPVPVPERAYSVTENSHSSPSSVVIDYAHGSITAMDKKFVLVDKIPLPDEPPPVPSDPQPPPPPPSSVQVPVPLPVSNPIPENQSQNSSLDNTYQHQPWNPSYQYRSFMSYPPYLPQHQYPWMGTEQYQHFYAPYWPYIPPSYPHREYYTPLYSSVFSAPPPPPPPLPTETLIVSSHPLTENQTVASNDNMPINGSVGSQTISNDLSSNSTLTSGTSEQIQQEDEHQQSNLSNNAPLSSVSESQPQQNHPEATSTSEHSESEPTATASISVEVQMPASTSTDVAKEKDAEENLNPKLPPTSKRDFNTTFASWLKDPYEAESLDELPLILGVRKSSCRSNFTKKFGTDRLYDDYLGSNSDGKTVTMYMCIVGGCNVRAMDKTKMEDHLYEKHLRGNESGDRNSIYYSEETEGPSPKQGHRQKKQKICYCNFRGCEKRGQQSSLSAHIREAHLSKRRCCPHESCPVLFHYKSELASHLQANHLIKKQKKDDDD